MEHSWIRAEYPGHNCLNCGLIIGKFDFWSFDEALDYYWRVVLNAKPKTCTEIYNEMLMESVMK